MGRHARNILGKRFGKLVAVEYLGLRSNGFQQKSWWKFQCDCGRMIELSTMAVCTKNRPRTHCGCVKHPGKPKQLPTYDLTGQIFGELTVLEFAGRDKIGNYIWLCRCSCGEICTASTVSLRTGNKRSCGHLYSIKNKIYLVGGVGICLINNGEEYFWFDAEDIDTVVSWQWSTMSGYAYTHDRRSGKDMTARYNRMILGLTSDKAQCIVDHINGDIRDNRKCNLRICSTAENVRHRSGVKGWYLDRSTGRYFSRIRVDGKIIHLGMFDAKEDAAAAYRAASVKYHGEFGAHQKIVWFPGWDNDVVLQEQDILSWVNFLHNYTVTQEPARVA